MMAFSERIQAEFQKRTKKTDGKYFSSGKRTEQEELKDDLNSNDVSRQKDAVKRIIANMTVGRDVSPLFTEVVMVSRTTNMELKKLIYLYIMGNAKLKPDVAILAVNTFIQDSQSTSPVIRALAIRTMLCVRVENMDQHCSIPLRKALDDPSEYVRKTAAVAVLKLFHSNPKACEDQNLVDVLRSLLTDSAPLLVANVVLALNEIHENSNLVTQLTPPLVGKLLNTLPQCTEWGQVNILDFIAKYRADEASAESTVERILPRLQHSNHAVVLSALRCVFANMDVLSEDRRRSILSKLTPAFVSLMSAPGETQYVALRNIHLLMQKYSGLFSNKDVKVFFCHYTDMTCVKLEKLNMLLRLFNERNVGLILRELREYCEECEPVFVAKSVQALGSCAVRLESAAMQVAEILVSLAQKPQLVQPVLAAVKDVLRKYPDMFLDILPPMLEQIEVDVMEDPEAKVSLIWCMGEFGEQLPDVKEKLMYFVETYDDHATSVQLATLTATVKFFLRDGVNNEEMLNDVLRRATANENPDLRDRAYMYWRMVSSASNASRMSSFVIGKKPPIRAEGIDELDPSRLTELLNNFNTVAAVYHKAPGVFVRKYGLEEEPEEDDEEDFNDTEELSPSQTLQAPAPAAAQPAAAAAAPQPTQGRQAQVTLSAAPATTAAADLDALFDFGGPPSAPTPAASPSGLPQLLAPAQCDGLLVCGRFEAQAGGPVLRLEFQNTTPNPMTAFAIQFNTNMVGLKQAAPLDLPKLDPKMMASVTLPVASFQEHVNKANPNLQLAFRHSAGRPFYCVCDPPLSICLQPTGGLTKADFIPRWKEISEESKFDVPQATVQAGLQANGLLFVGGKAPRAYYSGRTISGTNVLLEAMEGAPGGKTVFSAKADDMAYAGPWLQTALAHAVA